MLASYDYTCPPAGGREETGSTAGTHCINNVITYTHNHLYDDTKMTIGCDESDSSDIGSPAGSPQPDFGPAGIDVGKHSEKAPHLVARRNARERRRVQAVNNAFSCLRRHVPYENRHKRLSKVKTLRYAIDYIKKLQDMLEKYDSMMYSQHTQHVPHKVPMMELTSSRENTASQRWVPLDLSKMSPSGHYGNNNNNSYYPIQSYGSSPY